MYEFKMKEITKSATGGFMENDPYSNYGHWDINYSDILSDLICKAGRYCKHYASDLFITWCSIKENLENPDYKGDTYLFGFRDMGVDHTPWIQCRLDDPWKKAKEIIKENYKEIMMLTVRTDRENNIITMIYGPAELVE